MVSVNGHVTENLTRAEYRAEQAAQQGADLVLLPELFTIGYEINANAWRYAEPQAGQTEQWWVDMANRHGFYLVGIPHLFFELKEHPYMSLSWYCVYTCSGADNHLTEP